MPTQPLREEEADTRYEARRHELDAFRTLLTNYTGVSNYSPEFVMVPDGEFAGIYARPGNYAHREAKTLIEVIAGYSRLAARNQQLPVCLATPEKYDFVIGLVVCGLAKRIQL